MKKTLEQLAREAGISVAALKRQIAQERAEKRLRKAAWELAEKSAGYNPRAGNTKKNR